MPNVQMILDFISRNWISLSIIAGFSYMVVYVIRWYGKIGFREGSILFMQGILVILIMYFLQWSITSSGGEGGQEINFFLFQVEVEGKNFLNTFQEAWDEQGRGLSWSTFGSKMLPAFLEEFFKFVMLIFFLKNTTRYILVTIFGLLGLNIIMSGSWEMSGIAQIIILLTFLCTIWVFFGHKKQLMSSVNHGIYMVAIIAAGFAF